MAGKDGRFSTVIRKGIRKLFFKEANKGMLVNDLLEKHYDTIESSTRKAVPTPSLRGRSKK